MRGQKYVVFRTVFRWAPEDAESRPMFSFGRNSTFGVLRAVLEDGGPDGETLIVFGRRIENARERRDYEPGYEPRRMMFHPRESCPPELHAMVAEMRNYTGNKSE